MSAANNDGYSAWLRFGHSARNPYKQRKYPDRYAKWQAGFERAKRDRPFPTLINQVPRYK